ncbi:hypothetical protein, partial [Sulfurimonas sp.]
MNFRRVILLILFSSISVFADDPNYITDFGIYVYGDIQSIQNAFVLVQAVAASDAMPWIIGLITAFYLPYTAYEYFQTGSGKTLFINLTYMTASLLFMDTVNLPTTVHIEDLRAETNIAGLPAKTYAQVDGIPYPIAALTSTVSTITDAIKTVYEDAIQVVNVNNGLDIKGASYGSVGFGNAIGDIIKIARLASFDTGDKNSTRFGRATTAYMTQCVLDQAINQNPDLIKNITNPPKDIFLSISPDALNITGDSYKIDFDSTESTCEDFYNNEISDKYSDEADKLQARINKDLVGNTNNSDVLNAYISEGADINDSFISSQLGKFQAYAMNAAALAPTLHAFRNASVNLTSGQDLANSITAGESLSALQNEGVGRFKWMMEILPMGFHYMLGVIYSISILIMIVATALGYQKGTMIWKNFAKGLMTFEFIKVALVIITSTINQYAATHAADFIASVGQNPMTIKSIPYTMHYMATMAGVAGILGISAIFMIPAMVFSGEVGMAAGALSGLASRYKGNDIETATGATAKQKAQNDAYERELQDQAMLDHMGVSVPKGMGASQFYAEYQRGAQMANSGYGAMEMGTTKMAEAGHAVKGQTMQNISAMSTLDSGTTMQDFVSAGVGQGMTMNKNIGSMSAYGNSTTMSNARREGEIEGTMQGSITNEMAKDVSLSDAANAGKWQGAKKAGSIQGDSQLTEQEGSESARAASKALGISRGKREIAEASQLIGKFGENLDQNGEVSWSALTDNAQEKIDDLEKKRRENKKILADHNMSKSAKAMASSSIKNIDRDIQAIRDNKSNYEEKSQEMSFSEMANIESEAKLTGEMATIAGAKESGGVDNFIKGTKNMAAKKAAMTAMYGKETNMGDIVKAGEFEGINMAAKDMRIGADTNLEGDARTLGNVGADKMIQQARGYEKAQVFNKEGKNSQEHDKFMEGGSELQRKSLNEKELAMGAAMADKSEKDKRQMNADLEASSAGITLDQYSKAKGLRKTLDVNHDKDGYINSVDNDKGVTWKDTDGKTYSMSRAKANELIGDSEMRGIIGKAEGIASQTNDGKNMSIITRNAMGAEAGNIAATNAAINAGGGVAGYAGFKAASSGVQTSEAIGATKGKLEEALLHDNPNMTKDEAKKMADAIVKGSTEGAEKFKEALKSLKGLAQTESATKTESSFQDIKARKEQGFLDSDGSITKLGKEAIGNRFQTDNTKLNTLLKNTDNPEENKKWISALEKKGMNMSSFKDKDGNPLVGQAMRNAIAKNQAMLYSHGTAIVGDDGKRFSGTVLNGVAQGSVAGGLSSVNDNSNVKKFGNSTQLLTQGKFKAQQAAFKVAHG